MANLLADRVLNSRIMDRPIRDTDIEALLEASLLLSAYGQDAPPLLDQLIQQIKAEDSGSDRKQAEGEEDHTKRLA